MEYALQPRMNDREQLISVILEFLINEYSYSYYCNTEPEFNIIDVKDIRNLIQELKENVSHK